MSDSILFIHHYETELVDTAWAHLGKLGFDQVDVKPFKGEPLPDSLTDFAGIVIYGGSQNITELDQFPFLQKEIELILNAIEESIPVLGICLGGQLIAHALGGDVSRRTPAECEFGIYPLNPTVAGKNWIPASFHAVQAHYEEFSIPPGAVKLATSERFPNQAFCYRDNVYALQFHPETTLEILRDWQQADWAMYGINGAQSKADQDKFADTHTEIQRRWFESFLDQLFVRGKKNLL
ncbi:MAG: type 1 glutamine amidotransferase [Acidiferrobacterales bacterium]|nr:type 1 glutamine amidotransferase [Acidiferrobacterales bacterium]